MAPATRVAPCSSAIDLTIARPRPLPGAWGSARAIEAVEHALALALGQCPGPLSSTLSSIAPAPARDRDVDAAARRRVLDRVVEQVAQQDPQRLRLALHRRRVGPRRPMSMSRAGPRPRASETASRASSRQVDGCRLRAGRRAGLLPRQRQHLLDQPGRPVDAGGQPAPPRARGSRRRPARCRPCTCSFSAASGERSSCAASATKCCCASKAWRTRPNSRFSSCTSGRTSSGRPASVSGDRSSACRVATWRRTRATGASERLTTHHTTSISSGAISAIGPTRAQRQRARHAGAAPPCPARPGSSARRSAARTRGRWCRRACTFGKAQHRALRQRALRGRCGRSATPSGVQTCTMNSKFVVAAAEAAAARARRQRRRAATAPSAACGSRRSASASLQRRAVGDRRPARTAASTIAASRNHSSRARSEWAIAASSFLRAPCSRPRARSGSGRCPASCAARGRRPRPRCC